MRSSHQLGKFLLHFLLDVCVVLHLGEQRFGGGKISWWGRERDVKKHGDSPSRSEEQFHHRSQKHTGGSGGGGWGEWESVFRCGVWVGYLWAGQRLPALSSLSASLQVRGRHVSVQQTANLKKIKAASCVNTRQSRSPQTVYTETLQCVTPTIYCRLSTSNLGSRLEIIPSLLNSDAFINMFYIKALILLYLLTSASGCCSRFALESSWNESTMRKGACYHGNSERCHPELKASGIHI